MPREKLKSIKMDESEDNMSADDIRLEKNRKDVKVKTKKRSLVERELETSLTTHFTSPVLSEGMSTSRYGRARKLKSDSEFCDTEKAVTKSLNLPEVHLSTPVKFSPVAYKMHASNSSIHKESPKRNVSLENSLENQIENIYNANISLSRFGSEEKKSMTPSPAKKFYIRKDLIQSKEKEETVTLIKNMFSPPNSSQKNSHLNNILERSSEKFSLRGSSCKPEKPQNGYLDNSSVVKTLDFGSNKKKKGSTEMKPTLSKNELFEMEAKSPFQVGDLAWARMGTYPFWPSIITREPGSEIFIRKKLFGKVERDMIHVTFFGDNGRRSWILDSMLRKYQGLPEFEAARDAFTPETKKKDPRLYNAFFVSDKKLSLWYTAVEEADMLQREPKRFRIEILNQLLGKPNVKLTPNVQKSGKITRTDSDVSLSESLYDTLFSENDGKNDDAERSKHKSRNKSLDVSEVVTACLDNMAAKTGITMIQKQSHMDIWLQKAKSKTPEKSQFNITVSVEKLDNENPDAKETGCSTVKENESSLVKDKQASVKKKKRSFNREMPVKKPYSFRKSTTESQNLFSHHNEHDYSKIVNPIGNTNQVDDSMIKPDHQICVIDKVVSLCDENDRHGSPTFTQDNDFDISTTTDNLSADKFTNLDFENCAPESPTFTQAFDDTGLHEQTANKDDELINITENTNELTTPVTVADKSSDAAKGAEIMDIFLDEIHVQSIDKNKIPVVAGDIISDITICSDDDDVFQEQSTNKENKMISSLETTGQLESDVVVDISHCMDKSESRIATDAEPVDVVKDLESVDTLKDAESMDVAKDDEFVDVAKNTESVDVAKVAKSVDEPNNSESLSVAKDVSSNETKFQSMDQNETFSTDNHFLSKIPACSESVSESNTGGNAENNLEQNGKVVVIEILDDKYITNSDKGDTQKTDNDNNFHNTNNSVQNEEKVLDHLPNTEVVVEKAAVSQEIIPQKPLENGKETKIPEETFSNGLLNGEVDRISDDLFAEDDFDDNEDISMLDEENLLKDSEDEIEDTTIVQNNKKIIKKGPNANKPFFSTKMSTSESLHMVNGHAEIEHTKSPDEAANNEIAVDNISLKSVSDKESTFEPDTISINSLSSQVSDTCEILPQIKEVISLSDNTCSTDDETPLNTYKNLKHKRKVLIIRDSDTESASSLEDVALSELRKRTKAKTVSKSTEGSIESAQSDYIQTNKKLRLVLTDCLLVKENKETAFNKFDSSTNIDCILTKESKLPTVRKVDSNTNIEIEISEAENRYESNLSTPLNLRKSRRRKTKEPLEPTEEPSKPTKEPSEPVKVNGFYESKETSPEITAEVVELDTISINSSDSGASYRRRKKEKTDSKKMQDPKFLKYVELRQDALMDENPDLSNEEIMAYLYKTWEYEENRKSDLKKNDDIEQSNLVKGTSTRTEPPKKRKHSRKKVIDIGKVINDPVKAANLIIIDDDEDIKPRELPKRKASKPFYKEEFSDIEDEIALFEIFKPKKKESIKAEPQLDTKIENNKITTEDQDVKVKIGSPKKEYIPPDTKEVIDLSDQEYNDYCNEEEVYFEQLTKPKPNVFKGLIREKVCEICEKTTNLVKCKGCSGMFHVECVNKVEEIIEIPAPTRGRKKKKKPRGRRPKVSTESNEESQSDEKCQDANVSEENVSFEETKEPEPIVILDADTFEAQLEEKMKEMIQIDLAEYYSYSSDMEINWSNSVAGKCEIVNLDVKPKIEAVVDLDFKCKNCQKHDIPICFVCKSNISPKGNIEKRQKCQVPHCHKYYHLECLDHWPQTQFNSGEPSKNNKKIDEHFEAITCPRHVCHTCVCDDPRGCKTRFSGDKLARCVRCPATYHSFTKCLPAGSQLLSASHIVCPRHYEHRPGKVPCHVNTGWCFICALGGTLICCEYCPTSFHADCLNIQPPEGGYMCEDCETGRLPLYGEIVWVKLGHYRWWPGIVLHPCEIPDNIMAVKHSPGEFVVRFFGQYDHYWVNRGRVFPFQEGDSGRLSGQKSKIDEAFTKAMEHAQRAFEILKNVEPNDEENQDIASSLLPPHYVKLKVNKPCGSLYGKKIDIEESSLTQCECNPDEEEPCGPYSHCLNRMLLTECGPTCRAGDRCQNRAFEKRLYPKMVPYRTPHRGWGLKTLEEIKAGQFIIEYVGELIDEEEFRRRMRRKHEMRDENFYFLTLDKERMIDAGPKGNLARFMNHCCEPNCETQKWTVLGDVRVGLFAINDIPANTELNFNYNLECAGIEKKQCMCGAKRCSGYIGAKPKQDDSQPKKPKVPVKRTYKKRKNIESPSSGQNKPKRPVGRPPKPRELTEIEKDLLIIKNATNGLSSDSEGSGRLSSIDSERKDAKALKRKRVSFSTEEKIFLYNGTRSPSAKRMKIDDDNEVGD